MINRILHSWSVHIKFIKLPEGLGFFIVFISIQFSLESFTTSVLQAYIVEKSNLYIVFGWCHILLVTNFG